VDVTPEVWRNFFVNWPKGIERQGVVVTNFNDQVPFVNFLLSEHMILLSRRAPDAVGARKVIMPYGNIVAVKIVDPVNDEVFEAAGFKNLASI